MIKINNEVFIWLPGPGKVQVSYSRPAPTPAPNLCPSLDL